MWTIWYVAYYSQLSLSPWLIIVNSLSPHLFSFLFFFFLFFF